MKEFFELYESQSKLSLSIGHNSIADWCVVIGDRQNRAPGNSKDIISIQECNYELALAKAYVALCEWLSEHRGGY